MPVRISGAEIFYHDCMCPSTVIFSLLTYLCWEWLVAVTVIKEGESSMASKNSVSSFSSLSSIS